MYGEREGEGVDLGRKGGCVCLMGAYNISSRRKEEWVGDDWERSTMALAMHLNAMAY